MANEYSNKFNEGDYIIGTSDYIIETLDSWPKLYKIQKVCKDCYVIDNYSPNMNRWYKNITDKMHRKATKIEKLLYL